MVRIVNVLSLSWPWTLMMHLPPELIEQVLVQLESLLLPYDPTNADPFVELDAPPPGSQLPSLSPQPSETARQVWHNICLVDSEWSQEARRFMWSSLAIARPRAFESILKTIEEYGGGPSGVQARRGISMERSVSPSTRNEDTRGRSMDLSDDTKWSALSHVGLVDRTQKTVSDPVRLPPGDSPLLWTKVISFARFRTAGLRRSIRQGSHERFVTPQRLLYLLKGTRSASSKLDKPFERYLVRRDDPSDGTGANTKGRLDAVGFTEFMDSAISVEVLEELLFRGGWQAEYTVTVTPPAATSTFAPSSSSRSRSPFAERIDVPPTHHEETESEDATEEETSTESETQSDDTDDESAGEEDNERGRSTDIHTLTSAPRSSLSPSVNPPRPVLRPASSGSRTASADRSVAFAEQPVIVPRRPSMLRHSSTSRSRTSSAPRLERRSSGSVFASSSNEDEESRGRSRRARRQQQDDRRAEAQMSSASIRSSSVPASAFNVAREAPRASSVPPVSRADVEIETRTEIRTEGNKTVTPIRALDLCACVSSAFINSLEEFCSYYRLGHPARKEDDDSHDRLIFPHLRRLGLASLLIPSALLTTFVSTFPYLTHLDLTSTLATPALLAWLAKAGQDGTMRLDSLSLARCRLLTGTSIVGLLCGDCPPFTSTAGILQQDETTAAAANFTWGKGESTKRLKDLSLFGDLTKPTPLSQAELRLVLTVAPALTSNFLRTLDLSSAPIDDAMLDLFPPQPHLIELGLACCRQITVRAVANLLETRCPSVEVLDLSFSCPATVPARRPGHALTMSSMELHTQLIAKVASTKSSSPDPVEAQRDLEARKTHLRVIELDEKALEAIQGGAGDWKIIWGKGRRGWYVDTATVSEPVPSSSTATASLERPRRLRHAPRDDPRRKALLRLSQLNGVVPGDVGWHARKMEVLTGQGMMGREDGLYVFHAYQV